MVGRLLLALLVGFVTSTAAQSSVLEFLQSDPTLSITAKFVELADAPAIFGPKPSAGIVLFAPTDSAWSTAADRMSINLDPLTASKADGEELGSIMMYNMISAAGVSAEEEGSPQGLADKQSIQSLLGVAYEEHLNINFSQSGGKTIAHGLASGNDVALSDPKVVGKTLVYLTDTVLLPADKEQDIPVPLAKRRRRQ